MCTGVCPAHVCAWACAGMCLVCARVCLCVYLCALREREGGAARERGGVKKRDGERTYRAM